MLRSILIYGALALLLAGPALADDGPCDRWSTRAAEAADAGALVLEMAKEDVPRGLKLYNAEPPATDFKADRIFIARALGSPMMQIALVLDGCVQNISAGSVEAVHAFWLAARGSRT